jgi:dienelactone hydrolase
MLRSGLPVFVTMTMIVSVSQIPVCRAIAATAKHDSASTRTSEKTRPPAPATASRPVDPALVSFRAPDGTELSADLYPAPEETGAPIILLFHQAGSNAAEYAAIAPHLVELGWNALAVDTRSGGRMWNRNNRTVMRLGRSTDFLSAYPDLEAALAWAKSRGYAPPLVVWGSSYTSALVLRLAAEHDDVGAVMSFSPGEYLGPDEPVRAAAAKVKVPIFVTTATGHEVDVARWILDGSPSTLKVQYVPTVGVHGSSTLRKDRNPGGSDENWEAVAAFLARLRRACADPARP